MRVSVFRGELWTFGEVDDLSDAMSPKPLFPLQFFSRDFEVKLMLLIGVKSERLLASE